MFTQTRQEYLRLHRILLPLKIPRIVRRLCLMRKRAQTTINHKLKYLSHRPPIVLTKIDLVVVFKLKPKRWVFLSWKGIIYYTRESPFFIKRLFPIPPPPPRRNNKWSTELTFHLQHCRQFLKQQKSLNTLQTYDLPNGWIFLQLIRLIVYYILSNIKYYYNNTLFILPHI